MSEPIAITRLPGPDLARGERTFVPRDPIDLDAALAQHGAYRRALAAAGCRVVVLPPAEGLPDAVFVEDPAVVLDEAAVLARPGPASRRREPELLADELSRHRPVIVMRGPGVLEGGDVVRIGRRLFVGEGPRSDEAGVRELASLVEPLGYQVTPVPVQSVLHLKTAACYLGGDTLLVNPEWVDVAVFEGVRRIEVASGERRGANAVAAAGRVVMAASAPHTAEQVAAAGFEVVAVELSAFEAAEGGPSCLSLLIAAP